jgi:hypothetical protein
MVLRRETSRMTDEECNLYARSPIQNGATGLTEKTRPKADNPVKNPGHRVEFHLNVAWHSSGTVSVSRHAPSTSLALALIGGAFVSKSVDAIRDEPTSKVPGSPPC